MVASLSTTALELSKPAPADFVEVMLIMGASRLNALSTLSKQRGQTVGQIVRALIDRELDLEVACG